LTQKTSRKKLLAQLKELAKQTPQGWQQFYEVLFSLADPDHKPAALDCTASIAATSFIDFALRKAITTHFRKDITESELNRVFDEPNSPLSNLSAKITFARALGIIQDDEVEDLNTIRAIRNAFAHSMVHVEFSHPTVSTLCNQLGIAAAYKNVETDNYFAKHIFISSVGTLFFNLISYYPGVEQDIFNSAFHDSAS